MYSDKSGRLSLTRVVLRIKRWKQKYIMTNVQTAIVQLSWDKLMCNGTDSLDKASEFPMQAKQSSFHMAHSKQQGKYWLPVRVYFILVWWHPIRSSSLETARIHIVNMGCDLQSRHWKVCFLKNIFHLETQSICLCSSANWFHQSSSTGCRCTFWMAFYIHDTK